MPLEKRRPLEGAWAGWMAAVLLRAATAGARQCSRCGRPRPRSGRHVWDGRLATARESWRARRAWGAWRSAWWAWRAWRSAGSLDRAAARTPRRRVTCRGPYTRCRARSSASCRATTCSLGPRALHAHTKCRSGAGTSVLVPSYTGGTLPANCPPQADLGSAFSSLHTHCSLGPCALYAYTERRAPGLAQLF